MRKAIAGLLGLPVIGAMYLLPVARRRAVLRVAGLVGVGALFTLVALSSSAAPAANAFRSAPVDPAALARISTTVVTGHSLSEPVTVVFSEPVDEAKVTTALQVTPTTAVRVSWSPDGTLLHVAPVSHWAPSTLYTIGLATTAVGLGGTSLPSPLSAVFLTRGPTTASMAVEASSRDPGTPAVNLSFSAPVTAAAIASALTVTPAVAGRVTPVGPDQGTPDTSYVWRPIKSLPPGASYTLTLATDLRDTDGAPLAAGSSVDVQVPGLPAVVRTRPAAGATNVPLDQAVSVRFTQPMDRASTQAAFHITGFTSPATQGRFSWAEGDTVLVWTPRSNLGYGSHYTVTIDGSAHSAAGQPLAPDATATTTVATATFSTVPRPVAKPKTVDKPKPSGGSSTSAPLYSTEKYFLSLINCDHTGGWVSSSGVCTGRGSNGHAALSLSAAISNGASRPWAKYLAQTSQLYHGCPSCRLAAIGYSNAWWGENLAWWSGTPTGGAIQAVLFFQSEKASLGGHYVNMMDTRGHSAGVGVWQANGRVVFCIDFWGG